MLVIENDMKNASGLKIGNNPTVGRWSFVFRRGKNVILNQWSIQLVQYLFTNSFFKKVEKSYALDD